MSLEGDARPERQSSAEASRLVTLLAKARRSARPAFAGFVLLHAAGQAYRAHTAADHPEPGPELRPWVVASALFIVCSSFASLGASAFRRSVTNTSPPARTEQARALSVAEQLSLLVVALFMVLHVAETAWPLLTAELAAADLHARLVLLLSSTRRGAPLHAFGYVCGVGAAAFFATRQALAAIGKSRPSVAHGIVLLGVLAYLLGSYAVIRCAGGAFFS